MSYFSNSCLVEPTVNRPRSIVKSIQHMVEFLIITVVALPLMPFGHKNNVKIYRFIFGLFGRLPFLNKRVVENLSKVYPEKSKQEILKIANSCWQNLGNVSADYIFSRRLFNRKKFYEIEGIESLKELQKSGKNAIFFSGHISSWEIFRIASHHNGTDVAMIYRAFNNPFFDWLARHNMDHGFAPVFQKGAKGIKKMIQYIRKGGNILILTDQRFTGGLEIPFFNIPAKTAPSIAEISLKYDIPIIPIFVERSSLGCFRIKIQNYIVYPDYITSHSEKITYILTQMNKRLEEQIRSRPEEWFWLHKRWK